MSTSAFKYGEEDWCFDQRELVPTSLWMLIWKLISNSNPVAGFQWVTGGVLCNEKRTATSRIWCKPYQPVKRNRDRAICQAATPLVFDKLGLPVNQNYSINYFIEYSCGDVWGPHSTRDKASMGPNSIKVRIIHVTLLDKGQSIHGTLLDKGQSIHGTTLDMDMLINIL